MFFHYEKFPLASLGFAEELKTKIEQKQEWWKEREKNRFGETTEKKWNKSTGAAVS